MFGRTFTRTVFFVLLWRTHSWSLSKHFICILNMEQVGIGWDVLICRSRPCGGNYLPLRNGEIINVVIKKGTSVGSFNHSHVSHPWPQYSWGNWDALWNNLIVLHTFNVGRPYITDQEFVTPLSKRCLQFLQLQLFHLYEKNVSLRTRPVARYL